jgi:DNA-binding transcriptional ArsR family regulator
MKTEDPIRALSALAHPTRLDAFRALIRAGDAGLAAGELAAALQVPAPTLSFHLRHLSDAELVMVRREGRSRLYAVRLERVRALFAYLLDDCCQGRPELCGFNVSKLAACAEACGEGGAE